MKGMAKIIISVAAVLLVFGTTYAGFESTEDAIKYRKSVMFLTAKHFKLLGSMVQGKVAYDKDSFIFDAVIVEMLAWLPWEAMMLPGSDKGDTTLSPAVLEKPAQFKEAADAFEAATAKLAAIAETGDFKAVKEHFGAVAQNCSSCHQAFRKK